MLPQQIYLADSNEALCSAWRDAFNEVSCVEVVQGDFFAREADALVSPANSFGIMDGGLDAAIQHTLEGNIMEAVQKRILKDFHGELPVGAALVVKTEDRRWPYLVAAPTMRVPERISGTLNPYHAFRATLLAVARHNEAVGVADISSVLVPGLGTGVGAVSPTRCATLMRMAYNAICVEARIPSFGAIHGDHLRMTTA